MSAQIRRKLIGTGAGTLLFLAVWLVLENLHIPFWGLMIGYLAAYVPAVWDLYGVVFHHLKNHVFFDEHVLIVAATIGAFLLQRPAEAVVVTLFFQYGKILEMAALEKTKGATARFLDIKPPYATRKIGARECTVDPCGLKVGHVIVVRPGERIPVDAVVTAGQSTVDTKAITGEPMPQEVTIGSPLYSGSINLTGVLEGRVARLYQDSTASRILNLVEKADQEKSRSEILVERFTKYYTPAVILLAVLLMLLPPLIAGGGWETWLYRGMVFLVTAIPCGLVLSVPLALFGGLGTAARKGILIKGYHLLEKVPQAGTFVFDKTGTLTQGTFSVSQIRPRRMEEAAFIEKMAYAEANSNHPIAHSIREFYGKEILPGRIGPVQEISGSGVQAEIDGQEVLAGNARFLGRHGIFCQKPDRPGTAVHLAVDGEYEGYVLITDSLRPDTRETIRELKRRQMLLALLTGDSQVSADQLEEELGLDYAFGDLLPQEKVAQLEAFLEPEADDDVVFVGDGLNDAPVLARADIGIAMGGLGADAALEAADIILLEDEPSRILTLLQIARDTLHTVRQNILFAIAMKGLLLFLATVGAMDMKTAILTDIAVLFINLLNAYWVLRWPD